MTIDITMPIEIQSFSHDYSLHHTESLYMNHYIL
jgi:hypothetical protein